MKNEFIALEFCSELTQMTRLLLSFSYQLLKIKGVSKNGEFCLFLKPNKKPDNDFINLQKTKYLVVFLQA